MSSKKDKWSETRRRILARDEGKCRLCGGNKNLDVHHLVYDMFNINSTSDEHLITLCKICHGRISGIHSNDYGKIQPIKVGTRIEQLRKGLGLTQEALALKLGVSAMTIRRWEAKKNSPSSLALRELERLQRET